MHKTAEPQERIFLPDSPDDDWISATDLRNQFLQNAGLEDTYYVIGTNENNPRHFGLKGSDETRSATRYITVIAASDKLRKLGSVEGFIEANPAP